MNDIRIVPLAQNHLPAIKTLIRAVELFPEELLEDIVTPYFEGNPNKETWLVAEDVSAVGIVYCKPEYLTAGTANMLLLAVHPEQHRRAIGSQLVQAVESVFRDQAFHLMIVETSGTPSFEYVRQFYLHAGFTQEAIIRNFYAKGDPKVVMTKSLD
jgi:ribosomal protein S18 acetylase RimI-like enzyme